MITAGSRGLLPAVILKNRRKSGQQHYGGSWEQPPVESIDTTGGYPQEPPAVCYRGFLRITAGNDLRPYKYTPEVKIEQLILLSEAWSQKAALFL